MHGRVSMLAALGFIVGEQLQDFPLFFNWDGRVSGEWLHNGGFPWFPVGTQS